ncbi:MAG: hypothetical protein R2776_06285 [Flavobacteriaceae bacterium]
MKFRNLLLISFCLVLFQSCFEKTNFTTDDLEWVTPYETGDTLLFQETSSGIIDTTFVLKKIVDHGGPDIESSTKRMEFARITYSNRDYFNQIPHGMKENEFQLISMFKLNNGEVAEPYIGYKGFGFSYRDYKQPEKTNLKLQITNKSLDKVLLLDGTNYNRLDPKGTDIQYLYWELDNGIVKYVTYDGAEWERIGF